MKEVLLILIGVVLARSLSAQTFSEWFRQNSTQLRYLREQIAALQEYVVTLNKGYALTGEGLGAIDTVVEGDLWIHTGHFTDLEKVSPAVGGDPRIAAIRGYLEQMPYIARAIYAEGALQPQGTVDWKTFAPVLAERIDDVAFEDQLWLGVVLEDDQLQLSDAERESIIGTIYQDVKMKNEKALYLLGELQAGSIKPGS